MSPLRIAGYAIMLWAAASVPAAAQETVTIEVPIGVSFPVSDVTRSTSGAPSPSTITFSNAMLTAGKSLRVSVQADAAVMTPPSGTSIPTSKLSWTPLGAGGGIGSGGTLSSSSYTLVFQSDPGRTFGHVDLAWTLAATGSGIRSGAHHLTIRWKLESITP